MGLIRVLFTTEGTEVAQSTRNETVKIEPLR
jgi:hypothetical protein